MSDETSIVRTRGVLREQPANREVVDEEPGEDGRGDDGTARDARSRRRLRPARRASAARSQRGDNGERGDTPARSHARRRTSTTRAGYGAGLRRGGSKTECIGHGCVSTLAAIRLRSRSASGRGAGFTIM